MRAPGDCIGSDSLYVSLRIDSANRMRPKDPKKSLVWSRRDRSRKKSGAYASRRCKCTTRSLVRRTILAESFPHSLSAVPRKARNPRAWSTQRRSLGHVLKYMSIGHPARDAEGCGLRLPEGLDLLCIIKTPTPSLVSLLPRGQCQRLCCQSNQCCREFTPCELHLGPKLVNSTLTTATRELCSFTNRSP